MNAEEYKQLTGVEYATYGRMVVTGNILYETETHYVTQLGEGIATWSKKWYRPMVGI